MPTTIYSKSDSDALRARISHSIPAAGEDMNEQGLKLAVGQKNFRLILLE